MSSFTSWILGQTGRSDDVAVAAKAIAGNATLKALSSAEEIYQAMKAAGTFGSDVLEALYSASLEFNTPLSVNPAAEGDDNDEEQEEADSDDE